MKYQTKILSTLFLILFSSFVFADDDCISFILLGQSNMAGQGKVAELPKTQRALPKNTRFYLNGALATLSAQKKFGPEVSFAYAVSAIYPNKTINIIKFAPGGSLMKDWLKNGQHYQTLKKQLERIHKQTPLNPAGVLWMQGERDTKSLQLAKNYSSDLKKFINMLRKDLKNPRLPFAIARVSIPEAFRPAVKEIRNAQENVSHKLPYVRIFSTDLLEKNPDKVHFNSRGQLQLGRLFAASLLRASPK